MAGDADQESYDAESTDSVKLHRLGGLLNENEKARRRRILENLDALTLLSLRRTRHYVNKDGDERQYPDPDLKTALQAQLAGARLLGVDEGKVALVAPEQLDALVNKARRAIAAKQDARVQEIVNGQDPTH